MGDMEGNLPKLRLYHIIKRRTTLTYRQFLTTDCECCAVIPPDLKAFNEGPNIASLQKAILDNPSSSAHERVELALRCELLNISSYFTSDPSDVSVCRLLCNPTRDLDLTHLREILLPLVENGEYSLNVSQHTGASAMSIMAYGFVTACKFGQVQDDPITLDMVIEQMQYASSMATRAIKHGFPSMAALEDRKSVV